MLISKARKTWIQTHVSRCYEMRGAKPHNVADRSTRCVQLHGLNMRRKATMHWSKIRSAKPVRSWFPGVKLQLREIEIVDIR